MVSGVSLVTWVSVVTLVSVVTGVSVVYLCSACGDECLWYISM